MFKVSYIYHSGFCVELDTHMLIFDYFKKELPVLPPDKDVFFFASHKHPDHFNLNILKLSSPQIKRFYLGCDIKLNENYLEKKKVPSEALQKMLRIMPGQVLQEYGLKIEAFRSTDEGNAFIVETEGRNIYHAGDLNYWYWSGESKAYNEKMEKDYKKEIDKLAGRKIDAAFVPLDPRLEEGYHLGMDYFMEKTDADMVFPMHMWDEYGIIEKYKKTDTGKKYAGKIAGVSEKNALFNLESYS